MGTSAGSIFAGLTGANVQAQRLVPDALQQVGAEVGPTSGLGEDWVLFELNQETSYRLPRWLPLPFPGSLQLTLAALREPLKAISGLAPAGMVSTAPIRRTIQSAVPSGWAPHPNTWIVACDYATGARVPFGRAGTPVADLADAVAASCAIPGFFRPVKIAGRQYVDGGLHSMSNLDLYCGLGLDLVICLNPLSTRLQGRSWKPMSRLFAAIRGLAARQIDLEADRLLAEGTSVLIIEPMAEDIRAIGNNVMDAKRCIGVVRTSLRTVGGQLRQPEAQELLRMLPQAARARRASPARALLGRVGLGAAAAF